MLYFYRPTIDWGRRLELGANTYRVLVHPTPPTYTVDRTIFEMWLGAL